MSERVDIRDVFFRRAEYITRVAQADDYKAPGPQDALKRLLVVIWRMLAPRTRRNFIAMLDDNLSYAPARKISDKERQEADVMAMLSGWQQVIANVSADDRGFAMSIMKKRGSDHWWPSDAQITRMKKLWAERSIPGADDIDVVEESE